MVRREVGLALAAFAESPLHRKGLLEAARAGRVPTSLNGAKRLSQRAQVCDRSCWKVHAFVNVVEFRFG